LADRYDLDLAPTLADLGDERARFDAAPDAAFEEARKVRRDDGLDDDVIDARLADPQFRARLNAVLVANGYKPLHETPIEEQRNDARQYIFQVERRQDTEPKRQDPDIDPDSIPDELVDDMLGQADFRKMLDDALVQSGTPKLADLDADRQRAYARAMIAAIAQARNQGDAGDEPGPDAGHVEAAPEAPAPRPQRPLPPAAQLQPEPAESTGGVLSRFFGSLLRRNR
jgi:hypothetical protein